MVCPDCERWHEKVEGGEPSGGGSDIGLRGGVSSSTRRSGSRPWRYAGLLPDGAVPDQLRNGERGAGAHRRHRWLAERRPPRAMGYRPRTQGNPKQAKTALPQRHRVFGNRNPWLRGTHQRVGHQHL